MKKDAGNAVFTSFLLTVIIAAAVVTAAVVGAYDNFKEHILIALYVFLSYVIIKIIFLCYSQHKRSLK